MWLLANLGSQPWSESVVRPGVYILLFPHQKMTEKTGFQWISGRKGINTHFFHLNFRIEIIIFNRKKCISVEEYIPLSQTDSSESTALAYMQGRMPVARLPIKMGKWVFLAVLDSNLQSSNLYDAWLSYAMVYLEMELLPLSQKVSTHKLASMLQPEASYLHILGFQSQLRTNNFWVLISQ